MSFLSFQFKVLRSGSWQNMKPARGGNLQSNPWIRHYRSSRRCQGAGLLFLRENSASINKAVLKQKGKQSVSCGGATTTMHHHDSVASITGSHCLNKDYFSYYPLRKPCAFTKKTSLNCLLPTLKI